MSKFTFHDYWNALEEVSPNLKEIILERATQDEGIEFSALKRLVDKTYPEVC